MKMFSISNEELEKNPTLGDMAKCNACGKMHRVLSSKGEPSPPPYGTNSPFAFPEKETTLEYINCQETGRMFLVGIDGKQVF